MNFRNLYGIVCASVCPMKENGSVDYDGVRCLTRHLVNNGIHCLYPNGTNGESLSLSKEERFEIARIIKEENAGKALLYIQCGAGTVAESYEHVLFCNELGVDGVGLMTPVFFPMDDQAMFRYYEDILPKVPDLCVYAYNIPTRSGNDLSAAVLGELMSKHNNLMGVKYSYPDLQRVQKYISCCPDRHASVLIGCDSLATACMTAGGDGWVSGPSAVFCKLHVALYNALKDKDLDTAKILQHKIVEISERISDIPEIPAIKYMLKRSGIIQCETCRAPLRPLTSAEKLRLDMLVEEELG